MYVYIHIYLNLPLLIQTSVVDSVPSPRVQPLADGVPPRNPYSCVVLAGMRNQVGSRLGWLGSDENSELTKPQHESLQMAPCEDAHADFTMPWAVGILRDFITKS